MNLKREVVNEKEETDWGRKITEKIRDATPRARNTSTSILT